MNMGWPVYEESGNTLYHGYELVFGLRPMIDHMKPTHILKVLH